VTRSEKEVRERGNAIQLDIIEKVHALCDEHGIEELRISVKDGNIVSVETVLKPY